MSTTAQMLIDTARTRIRSLTPAQLEATLLARDVVLVDVREPEELDDEGLIAGAVHAPRGMLEFWADPASPAHRPSFDPSRPTIVYSAAGNRSVLAAKTLQDLGYRDVAHLDGGLSAWKAIDLPVVGLKKWHDAVRSLRM